MWMICSSGTIIYFIYCSRPTFQAEFVSIDAKHCYLRDEKLYAEQFIKVTNNVTVVFDCGIVSSCAESPCNMYFNNSGDTVYMSGYTRNYHKVIDRNMWTETIGARNMSVFLWLIASIYTVLYCTVRQLWRNSGQELLVEI